MSGWCPISVLIPTKDEERNLKRCLEAISDWADEIIVVDSQSSDATQEIASAYGATVVQFHYKGGWPKKRQWALDSLNWKNDWILLLDADEILSSEVKDEIGAAIKTNRYNGYWVKFEIYFLGRMLRHGDTSLWKLSLFRKGKGRYEMRLQDQDLSMADMEVHEHVVVAGEVGRIRATVRHENFNSLSHYISKHNEYSNWEARVLFEGEDGGVEPSLTGNQAQRRRFLKGRLLFFPGSPVAFFLFKYIFCLGFLDGVPGFIYAVFKGVQFFHIKAKVFEIRRNKALGMHGALGSERLADALSVHNDRPCNRSTKIQSGSMGHWNAETALEFDSKYGHKPNFIERYNVWTGLIDKYSKSEGHVLDLGCGGAVLGFYAAARNKRVVCVDISEEMIKLCERKKAKADVTNISFILCDIDKLPIDEMGEADMIICSSVLEYMGDLDKIVRVLARLLARNGVLLLSMPNKLSIYRCLEPIAYKLVGRPRYYKHVRHVVALARISDKLKNCGLDVLEHAYYAKTPVLSDLLRFTGLERYSDNMFVVVSQKTDDSS